MHDLGGIVSRENTPKSLFSLYKKVIQKIGDYEYYEYLEWSMFSYYVIIVKSSEKFIQQKVNEALKA